MKIIRLFLLFTALFFAISARAGEDVMQLFDRSRQLSRKIQKMQVEFLISKDDALKSFPLTYFDRPEPAEMRDRIAFQYLWEKGQLRNIWNSYTSGTRNMLSEIERKELGEAKPEFIELAKLESDGPGRFFISEPRPPDAVKMASVLFRLSYQYQKELRELTDEIEEQRRGVDNQIAQLHAIRKK